MRYRVTAVDNGDWTVDLYHDHLRDAVEHMYLLMLECLENGQAAFGPVVETLRFYLNSVGTQEGLAHDLWLEVDGYRVTISDTENRPVVNG